MKHHYPPPEPFYRQQRTDLKKFDENYQAIDWSRKREPVKPEFGTPCEPSTGWRGIVTFAEEVRTEGSAKTPEDRARLEKAFIERTETND